MGFKINITDSAAFISLANELGMTDAAKQAIAGDFEGAINSFVNGLSGVFEAQGYRNVLGIIAKYGAIKFMVSAIPGAGKTFNFLGFEIKI